jgi:hypothetical protein
VCCIEFESLETFETRDVPDRLRGGISEHHEGDMAEIVDPQKIGQAT